MPAQQVHDWRLARVRAQFAASLVRRFGGLPYRLCLVAESSLPHRGAAEALRISAEADCCYGRRFQVNV